MTVASPSLDERVEALVRGEPSALADPYGLLRELRERGRVHRHGSLHLLTHYEDVRLAYFDGVSYSKNKRLKGTAGDAIAQLPEPDRSMAVEIADFSSLFLTGTDGDQHARLRGVAHRAFTPRRIARLYDAMQGHADALLDALPRDEVVDLRDFAYRLPLVVLLDMLEIPPADCDQIHEWSRALSMHLGSPAINPEYVRPAYEGTQEFIAYVEGLMARPVEERPDGDLLGDLSSAGEEGVLTARELSAMYVVLLLAGHETTESLIANGLIELLRRPDQWRLLCDDPALVAGAVEELLRFTSPVLGNAELTVAEVEAGGELLPPGVTVMPLAAAANRDPAHFESPDELDVRRKTKHHLAFGVGEHYCIGNQLARHTAITAFATLARRFPGIELVDETIGYEGTMMLRRPARLAVRLGS